MDANLNFLLANTYLNKSFEMNFNSLLLIGLCLVCIIIVAVFYIKKKNNTSSGKPTSENWLWSWWPKKNKEKTA